MLTPDVTVIVAILGCGGLIAVLLWNLSLRRQLKRVSPGMRQSEERLRALFDASPIGIVISNDDGRVLYHNSRWADLIGIDEGSAEVGEIDLRRLYASDEDRERVAAQLGKTGSVRDEEIELYDYHSALGWYLISMEYIAYEGGQAILGWFYDITERKSAEAELAATEAQLRTALDQMSGGVYMVDEDLNYLVINDRYRELYELPEALVGKGRSMIDVLRLRAERGDYGPGDPEKLLQERIEGYRSGQVERTVDTVPSGRVIETFRAPSGGGGGVVAVSSDITERKRAEAEIAEKTKVLEATMDNTDEGILMVDSDRAIVMHNVRVVELLELPEAFFEGAPRIESLTRLRAARGDYGSVDPDEHARRIIDAVTEVEKTAETQFLETTTPNGKVLEMRLNSLAGGGIVATYADITRRKEIEDELRLAKEFADAANKAKSEFLSSMSHELRTPMNAILGFSEHLIDDSDNPLNEEQQDSAEEILMAGRHLLELIEEVLDLAKIESGRVALSIESVDVPKVVGECLQLSRSFRTPVSVTYNDEVSGQVLPPVLVDRTRLKQIMINLLSNASKYNVEGGSVTVSSSVEGDKLRLIVSDTGKGIPPDRIEDLFSPFSRLGAEYGEIEGTGIGLTITKSLIEQMGGEIGVESTVGEGSTFWAEFEIVDEADQVIDLSADEVPEEIVPEDDGDAEARTVLYVEDNPANLRLMRKLLGRRGKFNLIDAPTAELGLALAHDRKPDVILMDINLPGMDGFQALKELQGSPGTKDIPVVAVTASVLPHEVEHGLRAGFVDYLKKPISLKVLVEAIDKATGATEEESGEAPAAD